MSKLDLKEHTDKEIVVSIVELPFNKFISVLNALSAIVAKSEKRGTLIADEMSNDIIEELFRRIVDND